MVTDNKIESLINWNYIGIIAAALSIVVSIYNINEYIEEQRSKSKR